MGRELLLSFLAQERYSSRVLQVIVEHEPHQPARYFVWVRGGLVYYWLSGFADYNSFPHTELPMEKDEVAQLLSFINTASAEFKQDDGGGLDVAGYSITVYGDGSQVMTGWCGNWDKGSHLREFVQFLKALMEKYNQLARHKRENSPPEDPFQNIIDFEVAGIDFLGSAPVCQELKVGDDLEVIPEKNNPFCDTAVRLDWHGQRIGYFPIDMCRVFGPLIHRGLGSKCVVKKMNPGTDGIPEVMVDWCADSRT